MLENPLGVWAVRAVCCLLFGGNCLVPAVVFESVCWSVGRSVGGFRQSRFGGVAKCAVAGPRGPRMFLFPR